MRTTRIVMGLAAGAMLSVLGLAAHAEDKQLYIIGVFHADVSNSFS